VLRIGEQRSNDLRLRGPLRRPLVAPFDRGFRRLLLQAADPEAAEGPAGPRHRPALDPPKLGGEDHGVVQRLEREAELAGPEALQPQIDRGVDPAERAAGLAVELERPRKQRFRAFPTPLHAIQKRQQREAVGEAFLPVEPLRGRQYALAAGVRGRQLVPPAVALRDDQPQAEDAAGPRAPDPLLQPGAVETRAALVVPPLLAPQPRIEEMQLDLQFRFIDRRHGFAQGPRLRHAPEDQERIGQQDLRLDPVPARQRRNRPGGLAADILEGAGVVIDPEHREEIPGGLPASGFSPTIVGSVSVHRVVLRARAAMSRRPPHRGGALSLRTDEEPEPDRPRDPGQRALRGGFRDSRGAPLSSGRDADAR